MSATGNARVIRVDMGTVFGLLATFVCKVTSFRSDCKNYRFSLAVQVKLSTSSKVMVILLNEPVNV